MKQITLKKKNYRTNHLFNHVIGSFFSQHHSIQYQAKYIISLIKPLRSIKNQLKLSTRKLIIRNNYNNINSIKM